MPGGESMTGPIFLCPKGRFPVLNFAVAASWPVFVDALCSKTPHSAVFSAAGGHGVETRDLDDPKTASITI